MNQNAAGASSKLATAMQLIGQRKYVDAESILRELLASGSELAESFYGMGLIRFASSQMDAAATQFGNCVRLQPDNANAHYYLGQIAERSGDNTAAERFFEKALEINPKHAGALKKRPAHRDGHTSTPVARPTHDDEHITEGQPADGDLYSVLRRSNEPVEREMVRHMDAIAAMVGTRRSRSRAFLNVPLVVATLASLGMLTIAFIVAGNARNSRQVEPVMAPALIALAVLFLVAVALLKGRSATITCERDWLVLSKGMLRRSTVNKHLYLLSRHPVSV